MCRTGIMVYNCAGDETEAFLRLAPRFGVTPSLTSAAVAENNTGLALGHRCISVGHQTPIPASTLYALKETGVRYISTRSIGVDHIDTEAAKRLGIAVGNVTYSPGSVADYTLMLMLMTLRNAKTIVRNAERYDYRPHTVRGKELQDMTVGVLGTGRIGKEVIKRLRGFGCRVLAYDRDKDAAASYVSLRELLGQSDILTIHVPLEAATYHMIGCEQLTAMKRGAFLINTSRGGVVDTDALVAALEAGTLGGAALDVLEGEESIFYQDYSQTPPKDRFLHRLQQMPNVIVTPHTAYFTKRALYDTVENTLVRCLDFERNGCHG